MTTTPRDDIDELLEETFAGGLRSLEPGVRRLEVRLSVAVLLATLALAIFAPGALYFDELLIPLVLAYALASRIAYPLGAGYAVPTQLVLVPMFAVAPAALVPLMVMAGLALGTVADTLLGRSRLERLAYTGGDAAHALVPAVLLVFTGHAFALDAPWPLLALAFVGQLAGDLVFSLGREYFATGVRPHVQLKVTAQVWGVDLALTPVGFFAMGSTDELAWAPVFLALLLALFGYTARDRMALIGRAYERLQTIEQERRRLRIAVHRIGEAFASNLDLDALFQITTSAAVDSLGAEAGRASSTRSPGRPLLRRASINETGALAPLFRLVERRALELDGVVEKSDGEWHAIAAPIGASAWLYGVVVVARRTPFAADERELLGYLCQQAGISAANVQQHEALHKLALTDELTGLANHRRFQELLDEAADRHRRTKEPLALLLLDIDDFKLLNDTYGHQAGDTVLAAVGRRLREESRSGDEPARYGGEEFAVALEGADLGTAHAVAERLRREVEALPLVAPSGDPLDVTVSIGIAAMGPFVTSKSELIGAADEALYGAKAAGKNGVLIADAGRVREPRFSRHAAT